MELSVLATLIFSLPPVSYQFFFPPRKLENTPLILRPRRKNLIIHAHVGYHALRRSSLETRVDIPQQGLHLGHSQTTVESALVRRSTGWKTYCRPMQARPPLEKVKNNRFLSAKPFSSSHRSGLKLSGSGNAASSIRCIEYGWQLTSVPPGSQ